MLKTVLLVAMTSAVITIQPAEYHYTGYNGVEMLPGPNYVLCYDACPDPTPKVNRVVLKRHIRTPEQRIADTYAKMDESLHQNKGHQAVKEGKFAKEAYAKLDGYISNMGKNTKTGKRVTNKDTGMQANEVVEEDDENSRTVYFELNSSVLSSKEKAKLDKWLSEVKINDFDVRGYTCQIGGEIHNKKLSEERAQIVKAYILSKKNDAVIEAEGMGKGHYVSPDNLPLNRRAEVHAFIANKPIPVASEPAKPTAGISNKTEAQKKEKGK